MCGAHMGTHGHRVHVHACIDMYVQADPIFKTQCLPPLFSTVFFEAGPIN